MTLLTPLALLGFLLAPLVVALHLHRRQTKLVEIPSLIPWENVSSEPAQGGRRWRIEYLLLLLLQLLALGALVFWLARPASTSSPAGPRVYVLDRGVLMMTPDPAPSRFEAARRQVQGDIRGAPSGAAVTVILADTQPRVLVSTTDHALAIRRLGEVGPIAATPDLEQAIRLGAGLVGRDGRLTVVYARGESLPALAAPLGRVSTMVIGTGTDDQSISRLSIRCTVGAMTCDALATLRNDGGSAVREDVVIGADGAVLGRESVQLPPSSDTDLSFAVPSARHLVELYLTRRDLVLADNLAWAVIPSPGRPTVTVIGDPSRTAPIARALSAVPNVRVVVRTPSQYKLVASGVPGLLVLAGWMPVGDLPATPSLLLVEPPRFPGAPAPGVLNDTAVSGEDRGSPLLDGVDLTSLDIPQGSGERLALPQELHPVVWAANEPLITAGVLGGRRVVTVAFDPTAANLSQLDAFPLLMANILRWSTDWLPPATSPGDQLMLDLPPATSAIDVSYRASLNAPATMTPVVRMGSRAMVEIPGPGVYTVTERGAWGVRGARVAANVSMGGLANAGGPIALAQASSSTIGETKQHTVWWPWLGLVAAIVITLEWLAASLSLQRRG